MKNCSLLFTNGANSHYCNDYYDMYIEKVNPNGN